MCVCVRRAAYITYRLDAALVSAAKVMCCIHGKLKGVLLPNDRDAEELPEVVATKTGSAYISGTRTGKVPAVNLGFSIILSDI